MTGVFADTYYFLAILNPKDAAHRRAVAYSESRSTPIITTTRVLTELADGLSRSANRAAFGLILEEIDRNPLDIIVPASQDLFERGAELYAARSDKTWSLTDCISFVVMREHGLTEALTGDRHFEQAGFAALLT